MLEVVKPKYGKVPQHSRTETEAIHPALGVVDITRVMSLREDLERSCKDKVLFTQVWPSNPDAKQIDRIIKMQTSPKGAIGAAITLSWKVDKGIISTTIQSRSSSNTNVGRGWRTSLTYRRGENSRGKSVTHEGD